MLKEKQRLILNNEMELGENVSDEAKGKGRLFTSRFIEGGIAHYEEFGDVLITKETLNNFIHTMVGCPVIIKHKDIDDNNADKERVGVVSKVWYNDYDGWFYCEGIIWDKQAIDLVKNQGWNVSCTYDFETDGIAKTHNGKKIDMEFTNGEFLHLALVPNPRYERANIIMNAKDDKTKDDAVQEFIEKQQDKNKTSDEKDQSDTDKKEANDEVKKALEEKYNFSSKTEPKDKVKDKEDNKLNNSTAENSKGVTIMSVLKDLENFVKGVINNADDKEEAKNEDKRKLIDEVGGILKDKVDEEVWRTIVGKLEKLSYEPSEDKKADNKSKNAEDEEKEEKFEEEKEIAENKCKSKNEEDKEEKKEEDKKEVKNSMDDVKKLVMGGSTEPQKTYLSKEDRFALGEQY